MRILLTGGTGFVGRHLTQRLCQAKEVGHILSLTRQQNLVSPHRKVKFVEADLTRPLEGRQFGGPIDVVVHLAGAYDFNKHHDENYINNVLATHHLVTWARNQTGAEVPRLVFASTYALGIGQKGSQWCELPLERLPSASHSYARSKAMAERIVLESGLNVQSLRLGIVVADSRSGEVEKADGPYLVMAFLRNLLANRVVRHLPLLPIPGSPAGILPLVPVDAVAEVLCAAVLQSSAKKNKTQEPAVFGVYNSASIPVAEFVEEVVRRFGFAGRIHFVKEIPKSLLALQKRVTAVPREVFSYALEAPTLHNQQFCEAFPHHAIPAFADYAEVFFAGFERFLREEGR